MIRILLCAIACLWLAVGNARADGHDPEIQRRFLTALEDIERGDYTAAISALRGILARDPSLHRVRLELARAYFLAEEWAQAETEFFAVLSADVPDAVRNNIRLFLREIDVRRGWSWDVSVSAIAGGGLTRNYRSNRVLLNVGVPLEFEIDRRNEPDFGMQVDGAIEFRTPLPGDNPRIFGRLKASVFAKEFPGESFDDYTLSLEPGAVVAIPSTTVVAGPVLSRRWYAQQPFEDRKGFEVGVINRSLPLFELGLNGAVYDVDSHYTDDRDGVLSVVEIGAARSIFGRASVGVFVGLSQLDAEEDFESYRAKWVGTTVSADLGAGFAAAFRPQITWTSYDETAPFFFEPEEQTEVRLHGQVTKVDWFLGPFNPYLSVGHTDHRSNNALNDYSELSFQVGLTKAY